MARRASRVLIDMPLMGSPTIRVTLTNEPGGQVATKHKDGPFIATTTVTVNLGGKGNKALVKIIDDLTALAVHAVAEMVQEN